MELFVFLSSEVIRFCKFICFSTPADLLLAGYAHRQTPCIRVTQCGGGEEVEVEEEEEVGGLVVMGVEKGEGGKVVLYFFPPQGSGLDGLGDAIE